MSKRWFDDDGTEFAPTKYPVREGITAALFILGLIGAIVYLAAVYAPRWFLVFL